MKRLNDEARFDWSEEEVWDHGDRGGAYEGIFGSTHGVDGRNVHDEPIVQMNKLTNC